MAFNLQAILKLNGNQFTNTMRKIANQTEQANRQTKRFTDSQGRMRDEFGRFVKTSGGASGTMRSFGRSLTSPLKGIGSLTTGIYGLVGAYAAVTGAQKAFNATIGEAARYEQSAVMIKAMMGDAQKAKDYIKMVDSFAVNSPIMDSQTMMSTSKGFITASKDIKTLEKMWSLAERMAAIDPVQGVEGAVFALRELFSGDAISMVERFEMPRAVMNDIKKMDLSKQLFELDKYFNKIGMTQELIDEMGGTTLGVWAQIKEASNVILRTMGMPALNSIRTFITGISKAMNPFEGIGGMDNALMQKLDPEAYRVAFENHMKIERFKETGKKIIKSVTDGLISAASSIGEWMKRIQADPEFQAKTTLFGKVKFIIEDIYQRFLAWLEDGGRAKIEKTTADLIQIVIAGLEASIENILPVAIQIGTAIGQGILTGVKKSAVTSWLGNLVRDPIGFAVNEGLNLTNKVTGRKSRWNVWGYEDQRKKIEASYAPKPPKKNGGVKFVPKDGAEYSLHRGEMILPRGEADNYRKGKNGGIVISGNTFNVRKESDIDAIAYKLAKLIEMEGAHA
jgi:hypothetical protein